MSYKLEIMRKQMERFDIIPLFVMNYDKGHSFVLFVHKHIGEVVLKYICGNDTFEIKDTCFHICNDLMKILTDYCTMINNSFKDL